MIAQISAWDWSKDGPLMTIIGALMIAIGFMFRTWVVTVNNHSSKIESVTNTYRTDIKGITDKQDETLKSISDKQDETTRTVANQLVDMQEKQFEKFENMHKGAIALITEDRRNGKQA